MKKPKHYYNRTYRTDFIYFIGWTDKQFERYCAKYFNFNYDASKDAGLTVEIQSAGTFCILIWTLDKKDFGALSHECNHAAAFTLKRVGVKPSFTNDEAFTYLSQDLFSFAVGE